MDSFAGNEPREFIPFYLGIDANGQPVQESTENNGIENEPGAANSQTAQETSSTSVKEGVLVSSQQTSSPLITCKLPPTSIEIIEDSGSQSSSTQGNIEGTRVDPLTTMDPASQPPHSPDYSPSLINMLASDQSSSEESIQSYFTRKVRCTEGDASNNGNLSKTLSPIKESDSSPISITPAGDLTQERKTAGPDNSTITFLEPRPQTSDEPEREQDRRASKRPRFGSASTLGTHLFSEDPSQTLGQTSCDPRMQDTEEMDQDPFTGQPITCSNSEAGLETDADSIHNPAGSTIAQALNVQTRRTLLEAGDSDSAFIPVGLPSTPKRTMLGPSSRALIKEIFTNAETFDFPKGHATIAFTEDQISAVVKTVAEETVRTSCDMMERLIQKASELNLGTRANRSFFPEGSTAQGSLRSGSLTTGRFSETSGALRSDDEFSSIGYSFEQAEHEKINAPPKAGYAPSCSYKDPRSNTDVCGADSPSGQTLASLKAEALNDRSKRTRNRKGRFSANSGAGGTRRTVTRSCKIMKEAYFRGMEWTRTFVSGPVDPRWNPYKLYCQECKANISIFGKGAREILRHYATEKHLRKDQRWRYEYLYKMGSF